jgi:hypothetical protein
MATLRMKNPKAPVPLEAWEQKTFVAKCRQEAGIWPELNLLYSIPNGAKMKGYYVTQGGKTRRFCPEAQEQIDTGLLAGMPDLCLPVARGGFHSLYIEMKQIGKKADGEQEAMHERLRAQGHCVVVAQGHTAAWAAVKAYLEINAEAPK